MAYIRVNCEFLDVAIKKLESEISSVENLQGQLMDAIEKAINCWDGEDAEAFNQIAEQRMKAEDIKRILKGLKNQKKRLRDAARLYRTGQENAKRRTGWLG